MWPMHQRSSGRSANADHSKADPPDESAFEKTLRLEIAATVASIAERLHMRLRTVLPISFLERTTAIMTVNDRPWAGFGPRTLTLVKVIPGVQSDGRMDVVADFDVDASGMADRIPPPLGISRKIADLLQAEPLCGVTDFAALFGDEPEFELGDVEE